ncbi:MAG: PrkA family serine protein kinase [Pseudomonadota bacterium]|nr:PrkA family serine protein kinase [Pseudomonadota bacterium]
MDSTSLFSDFQSTYASSSPTRMSLQAYLELCRVDPMAYALPAERMIKAIGEPESVETKSDPRLLRLFGNRVLQRYAPFSDFYGMEGVIQEIVSYFRHAAQGLEERKQVLYLLGPVGSAKSSLAEKLKQLMEVHPIFVLVDADGQSSPLNESPLGLFAPSRWAERLQTEFGIHRRYLTGLLSPWAQKRLRAYGGDISRFSVERVHPSVLNQVAISKTEPGDENNQDISALVGKVDIRKLDKLAQDDPDAYSYSGGLCLGNQGMLEFVEMFKAPIKVLNPLLTATQEGNFKGTEGFGAMPFQGLVLAHSNESEWLTFRNNKSNEAFLDRVYIVKVPYCLRVSEEVQIYNKLLRDSTLASAPCAPGTLEMLARFIVLTRLKAPENSSLYSKLRIYDGESLREADPQAKSVAEYREVAGHDEGMSGLSTRHAYKLISKAFDRDATETAADPVTLLKVIEESIGRGDLSQDMEKVYKAHLSEFLVPKYLEFIQKEIQTAYLESYSDYGQNLFDRYVTFADFWVQEEVYVDAATGVAFDKQTLNNELEKIEKPAGIANPKDFRNEVVGFVLRARAKNGGVNPSWTSYAKLREVIEKRMFAATDDILPVVSFAGKSTAEEERKHQAFVERMVSKGYTAKQVRRLVEWWMMARRQ